MNFWITDMLIKTIGLCVDFGSILYVCVIVFVSFVFWFCLGILLCLHIEKCLKHGKRWHDWSCDLQLVARMGHSDFVLL